MFDVNFKLIRNRVILLSVVLIVCSIVVLSSAIMLESKLDVNKQYKNNIRASNNSIAEILSNISLLNIYKHDFDFISANGFLSSENRLSWIEQIEVTATKLKLSNLQYQIDPQRTIFDGRYDVPSNVNLYQSTLSFETSLLHEGDLLDVVQDIAKLPSGLLVVDRCSITRIGDSFSDFNYNASCDMSWYTASYQVQPILQMGGEP